MLDRWVDVGWELGIKPEASASGRFSPPPLPRQLRLEIYKGQRAKDIREATASVVFFFF